MIPFSRIVVLAALSFSGVVQAAEFDDGARAKLIEEYAQKLQDKYVFPAKGKLLADSLRSHLTHRDYAGLEETALAEQVQKELDRWQSHQFIYHHHQADRATLRQPAPVVYSG
jgi:hypothetical protein